MIANQKVIPYNSDIQYIGFNIERGVIASEKVYRRKSNQYLGEIDNLFVKRLCANVTGVQLFSVEDYDKDCGTIKYDFLIKKTFCWLKAKRFLFHNVQFYDPHLVRQIEKVSWLNTKFTTLSVRMRNEQISNVILYYRRPPRKRAHICNVLNSMLPKNLETECKGLMHFMFSHGAWVRTVAVDFQQTCQQIKVYFETGDPSLICDIADIYRSTQVIKPLTSILEYTQKAHLLFAGMAIVMSLNSNNVRYNFYFTQDAKMQNLGSE